MEPKFRWGPAAGFAALLTIAMGSEVARAQTTWEQLSPVMGPASRSGAMQAYDSLRGRLVLFGGQSTTANFIDTWEWDGSTWTQMSPAHHPSGRRRGAMAFDAARGVCVLFGGFDGSVSLRDTWEYDGSDWVQRGPATVPPARNTFPMTYDAGRGVCVMFSGVDSAIVGGLWEYDGNDWVQRVVSPAPASREGAGLAYDAVRQVCWLFGGYSTSGYFADTWRWDGSAWTRLYPAVAPSGRYSMAMAYDVARDRCVLHGGLTGSGTAGDTWEWDGSAWLLRTPTVAHPPRYYHVLSWMDTARVMFTCSGASGVEQSWNYRPDPMPEQVAFGSGCTGSGGVPVIASTDLGPFVGDTFRSVVTGLPEGDPVVAGLLGFSDASWLGNTLPVDLTPYGADGCSVYQDMALVLPLVVDAGHATFDLPIPLDLPLQGLVFFEQALVLDPPANLLGLTLSGGLRVRVGGS